MYKQSEMHQAYSTILNGEQTVRCTKTTIFINIGIPSNNTNDYLKNLNKKYKVAELRTNNFEQLHCLHSKHINFFIIPNNFSTAAILSILITSFLILMS